MIYTGYWLAEQNGNLVTLSDGPHSKISGVVKAKKIINGIFGDRGKNYVMVKIEDVPDIKVKVNNTAIDSCKKMVQFKQQKKEDNTFWK